MDEVECPYCEKYTEINHDDGFGYEEGIKHEIECDHCGKTFVFMTSISYNYDAEKADCLNGGEHDYQLVHTAPKEFSTMECTMCDDRRELTDEERKEFGIGTKEDYFKRIGS